MEANNINIDMVIKSASRYLKLEKNIKIIKDAYVLANAKHEGQFRKSGEPYINHPLHVALLLSEYNAGPQTIAAGLLHDVVEDTDVTLDQVKQQFGEDVAKIVDGVTKISKLKYMTKEKVLAKGLEWIDILAEQNKNEEIGILKKTKSTKEIRDLEKNCYNNHKKNLLEFRDKIIKEKGLIKSGDIEEKKAISYFRQWLNLDYINKDGTVDMNDVFGAIVAILGE